VLVTALVLGFVALSLHQNIRRSQQSGHLAPKAPLQGIWNVHDFAIDGVVQQPLVTDARYWHRVFFDPGIPGYVPPSFQVRYLNQTGERYLMTLNTERRTVELTKSQDPNWRATLTYQELTPHVLVVEGTLDGRRLRIRMWREDESRLPINQPTHWIYDRR
jgi:hypothetical protein